MIYRLPVRLAKTKMKKQKNNRTLFGLRSRLILGVIEDNDMLYMDELLEFTKIRRDGNLIVPENFNFVAPLSALDGRYCIPMSLLDSLRSSIYDGGNVVICFINTSADSVIAESDSYCYAKKMKLNFVLDPVSSMSVFYAFARNCALSVLGLWDAPAFVRKYLIDGSSDVYEESKSYLLKRDFDEKNKAIMSFERAVEVGKASLGEIDNSLYLQNTRAAFLYSLVLAEDENAYLQRQRSWLDNMAYNVLSRAWS